jgi:hypothetical protein
MGILHELWVFSPKNAIHYCLRSPLQTKYEPHLIINMNLKTNSMSYTKIMSEEIVWCEQDDRHILIKKEHDVIVGLNFCQGDELEYFIENFMDIDHDLTNFYQAVKRDLCPDDEVNQINAAIWAYVRYKNPMWR